MEFHPQIFASGVLLGEVMTSIRLLAEKKAITLHVQVSDVEKRYVYGDKLRYEQILLNLLTNAVKYTPRGGTVWFAVEPLEVPRFGCNARVIVRDTGIGMSKAFQTHMFEPFVQERRDEAESTRGTGLGLTIVKQIVDRMGGIIEAESELGRGTSFTVYLPLQWAREPQSQPVPPREISAALSGRRILLAEDNDINAEIAETLLRERANAQTERAEDGLRAVELFQNSPPAYFDAILMDLRMPRMNGIEATQAIRVLERSDAKTIPIIAMTADAFSEAIDPIRQEGMSGYVTKPIDPRQLMETLLKELASPSREPA